MTYYQQFKNFTCHLFKSTDMKWLSVGRQKEGSFLDFLEFVCARCTTEMPGKGAVAKIRSNKKIENDKLALFN